MEIEDLKSIPQRTIPTGEEELDKYTPGVWFPHYGHANMTMTGASRRRKAWDDTAERQKVPQEEEEESWGDVAHEFCQGTSIHGLKPIEEDQPFVLRRFIWAALVVAGTVVFIMEMVSSVQYFSQFPVSVNVKINYNRTVHFPAVTLCNPNTFRTTAASRLGWYDMISGLFGHSRADLEVYNASSISLQDLYHNTAHRKTDMIVGCEWAQDTCTADDFELTLTDFGVCYTFNSGRDKARTIRKVTQSGTQGGLRLHLNVEQYEYMRGPNEGAGVRILLHNQRDVPMVRDLGAAVPPGTHGYLGVQIVEVHNLERPHGQCNRDKKVSLYDYYSMPNCVEDCKTTYLARECGCKDIYMQGTAPVCNLSTYQSCMAPKLADFNVEDLCNCPIPCERALFEPVITYATTSNFDLDKIMHSDYIHNVQDRFIVARETVERVNKQRVAKNSENIWMFRNATEALDKALQNLVPQMERGHELFQKYALDVQHKINFHKHMMGKVYYITQFDFERGWEIREERTIPYVVSAYQGLVEKVKDVAMAIVSTPENMTEARLAMWMMAEFPLREKLYYTEMAEDNITQVHESYLKSSPLLTYRASKDRYYDMSWVCPELFEAVRRRQYEYYNSLISQIKRIRDNVEAMLALKNGLLFNNTFNHTQFESLAGNLKQGARSYYYRMNQFKERVALAPLAKIQKELDDFEQENETLHDFMDQLKLLLGEVKTLTEEMSGPWQGIIDVSERLSAYLASKTMQITPLYKILVSKDTQGAAQNLTTSFSALRSRGRDLIDAWRNIENEYRQIWEMMLGEVCTKRFYEKVGEDITYFANAPDEEAKRVSLDRFGDLLKRFDVKKSSHNASEYYHLLNADFNSLNLSHMEDTLGETFDEFIRITDVTSILGETDMQLREVYESMKMVAERFIIGNEVNIAFYRENFLRLDIFMRELSYEEIIQEEAYGMTQLLCDIGGSLGLFIGASVLSLFEIFDAVIHHYCKKLLFRRVRKASPTKEEKPDVKYMWTSGK